MPHLLAGLAAIILWSMTIPLYKSVCSHMDPLCGIGVSFGIGGLFLSIVKWKQLKERVSKNSNKSLGLALFLFLAYQMLLVFAISGSQNNRQALEVGLTNHLWPMMMIVCSLIFFKQQWNLLLPLGLCLSFFGVVYASMPEFSLSEISIFKNPLPYTLAFIAAMCWALYSVCNRRYGHPEHPAPVSIYTLICGSIYCIWSLAEGTFRIPHAVIFDLSILTISTAFGYFLWDYAIHKGDLIILASMSYFVPLLSILFGAFYLDDVNLNITLFGGGVAVIIGAFLCKSGVKKPLVDEVNEENTPETIAST